MIFGADQLQPRIFADHLADLSQVVVDGVAADEHPLLQIDQVDLPAAEQKLLDQPDAPLVGRLWNHLLTADILCLLDLVIQKISASSAGAYELAAIFPVDGLHIRADGPVRYPQGFPQVLAGDGAHLII